MKISIIVPIYNVEKYIYKCLKSILNQTFVNWETILVDDGSTDESASICQEFTSIDTRFRYFRIVNSGPGPARNYGIEHSTGEWITFIDPDDWVKDNYLQRMIAAQNNHDSDIVVCQYLSTRLNSEQIDESAGFSNLSAFLCPQRNFLDLTNLTFMSWGKLFRAELLLSEGVDVFPDLLLCEDYACLPYYFAKAKSIEVISDQLYVWRKRTGSQTHQFERIQDRIMSMQLLVERFKRGGIFEQNKEELGYFLWRKAQNNNRIINKLIHSLQEDFEVKQQLFFRDYGYDANMKLKCLVFGGYTAYTVAKIIERKRSDEELQDYYGFSSIYSLIGRKASLAKPISAGAVNKFREKNIANELSVRFMQLNKADVCDCDYLLIDFSEERFDIAVDTENNPFTLSDAFLECELNKQIKYSTINRLDEDFMDAWKSSCNKFADYIKLLFNPKRIILIRSKLTEFFGADAKENYYEDIETIRRINELLDLYYDYFEELIPEMIVIRDLEQMNEFYTDSSFKHGVKPWHLNKLAYNKIAEMVRKKIFFSMIASNREDDLNV
ncbi:MAG: glycosyltransferase [Lachnospiraceae bacterium]|nr:glycosyltransferase [Lachnospiraceae bacterium]